MKPTASSSGRKAMTASGQTKAKAPSRLVAVRQDLLRMPLEVQVPGQAPKLTQLAAQVEMLHRALISLSDTVIDEIGGLRADVAHWRSDRDQWLSSTKAMRQEVNDKLLQVEQEQARAVVEVQGAKANLQASVGRSMEQLESHAKGLDRQLLDTRCEVQLLRNQVVDMQVLTSSDFPAAVLKQRLTDRASIQAQVDEVVQQVAPATIREAVQRDVPAMVCEQVLTVLKEVVENKVEPVRRQVSTQASAAMEGVEKLSVDMAQMAGELKSTQERCKAAEASCTALQLRLTSLEAEEEGCLRSLAVDLNERLEVANAQQASYAKSMEEVVRALVDDAVQLAKQAQGHDAALQRHQQHLSETREALLRCTTTFSQVLKIPSPISVSTLSAPLSPLSSQRPNNPADAQDGQHARQAQVNSFPTAPGGTYLTGMMHSGSVTNRTGSGGEQGGRQGSWGGLASPRVVELAPRSRPSTGASASRDALAATGHQLEVGVTNRQQLAGKEIRVGQHSGPVDDGMDHKAGAAHTSTGLSASSTAAATSTRVTGRTSKNSFTGGHGRTHGHAAVFSLPDDDEDDEDWEEVLGLQGEQELRNLLRNMRALS